MKALLTSSGIANPSIRAALVELMGKPVEEATALVVPTAIYPFSVGPEMAARLVRGEVQTPMCEIGWGKLGVLELSVLPSIDREAWVPTVQAADALLFWGGDPLFLSWWVKESGLLDVLPTLTDTVWVGTSAGAMAATTTIVETYDDPPSRSATVLSSEEVVFTSPHSEVTLVKGEGAGIVDFSLIVHLDNPGHEDASLANAATWASRTGKPTYAIDDQTALSVVDGIVEVVSEGHWELFRPR